MTGTNLNLLLPRPGFSQQNEKKQENALKNATFMTVYKTMLLLITVI